MQPMTNLKVRSIAQSTANCAKAISQVTDLVAVHGQVEEDSSTESGLDDVGNATVNELADELAAFCFD